MEKNSYLVDPDNSVELSRLLRQNEMITRAVSGFFPTTIDPLTIHQLLDVGCGPGGWLVNLVQRYPHIHATGVDISDAMITYARQMAASERLANLQFFTGSFLQLPFADESYDFVEARLVQWFLAEEERPRVLREWMRVLRPGGWLHLTEAQWPQYNGQALEIVQELFARALRQKYGAQPYAGIPYSESDALTQEIGPLTATTQMGPLGRGGFFYLKRTLETLGCFDIQAEPHLIDFSARSRDHDAMMEDFLMGDESYRPFLLASIPGLTPERLSSLFAASWQEMASPEFIGLQTYLSVWGRKPT